MGRAVTQDSELIGTRREGVAVYPPPTGDPAFRETVVCALAAQVLGDSGHLSLRVLGSSMLPSIWPGDVVTIRKAAISDLRPDDFALCMRDGLFIVHRVIANEGHRLVTRGDSLTVNDTPTLPDQVLGVVTGIYRGHARIPTKGKLSCPKRFLACLLRRSQRLRALVLRLHALRMKLAGA